MRFFNISHEIDSKTVKMPNNLVAPQKCSTFATSKQEKRRIAESNMPARLKQEAESLSEPPKIGGWGSAHELARLLLARLCRLLPARLCRYCKDARKGRKNKA